MRYFKFFIAALILTGLLFPGSALGQTITGIEVNVNPSDTTTTEILILGSGLSGIITQVEVFIDPADGGSTYNVATYDSANFDSYTNTQIKLVMNTDYSQLAEGDYFLKITLANGTSFDTPTVNITNTGGGGGTEPSVYVHGGNFSYETATTSGVLIYGDNLPSDLTGLTVGSYSVTVTDISYPQTSSPTYTEVKGSITAAISSFSDGNYAVAFSSATAGAQSFPEVQFNVDQSNMPQIYGGSFSESETGTGTKASFGVSNIAQQDVNGVTIGGNALSGMSYQVYDQYSMEISGTIALDPTALPTGVYDVVVSTTAGTVSDTATFTNYATMPQIGGGSYYPTGTSNQTMMFLYQKNIPDDLTSIKVGSFTATAHEFYDDPYSDYTHLVVWVPVSYSALSGNTLTVTVTINSASLGEQSFTEVSITPSTDHGIPQLGNILVYSLNIDPFLGGIRIDVGGEGLTSSTVTSVQVSADPDFTTGVRNATIDKFGTHIDEGKTFTYFEATLTSVSFSSFASGNYYVKVQTTDGVKIQNGSYEKPTLSSFSSMTFEQVGFAHYSSGKTLVAILGTNFDALHGYSDAQVTVSDQSLSKTATPYTLDIFGIDDDEGNEGIFGTVDVSADQFAAGNYYVQATGGGQEKTSDAINVTQAGVVPTSPIIYAIGSPFYYEDKEPNSTYFTIVGDLFTTISTIEISQDPTFTTGVYDAASWELETDAEGALDVIEGKFTASISSLPPGAWYFRITFSGGSSVTSGAIYHGEIPSGGGGTGDVITLTGGDVTELTTGVTEFVIEGTGFTTSNITGLDIYYVTSAGTDSLISTFSSTTLEINSTSVTASYSGAITSLPEGSYYLVLKTTTDQGDIRTPNYEITHGGTGDVITLTDGGVTTTSTGGTEFTLEGTGFTTSNITGLDIYYVTSSGTDSLVLPFTASELTIDATSIKALYSGAITSLPQGSYFFVLKTTTSQGDITTPTIDISHGSTTPVVTVYSFYMSTKSDGTGTLFTVQGSGFTATDITGLEIATDNSFGTIAYSFSSTELTVTTTTISADITTDLNSLPAGDYYARISAASLSGDYATVSASYTHDPTGGIPSVSLSIYDVKMGLDDNQIVNVWIAASGFTSDEVSGVAISTDPTFADRTQTTNLTVVEINENVSGNNVNVIIGTTGTGIDNFSEGNYYARILLTDGEEILSTDAFYFDPSAYQGPGDLDIYEVYIYDSPAGTKFVMVGEGFDSIANSTITIELAADSLFAGTTYNV
ncbi:MAG: hypothetical protein GY863_05450, partial [bacterium]|nr:hypothetical protein [bacterium]